MNPDRWNEIEKLYHAALARDPRELAAFLDACADEEVRREVRSLLEHQSEGDRLLENSPWKPNLERVAISGEFKQSLATGTRLGCYEIISRIGVGGMGEVYRAHDARLGRDVAIKVLPDHLARDPQARARFEREAKVVAATSHPNMLAIYDIGADQDIAFIVTELLEGETLRTRVARGALPWREASQLALAITGGLSAAHSKGITHRDLKPENIFLTSDGRVKILDFGIARWKPLTPPEGQTSPPTETKTGTVMGTLGYMSPEQVRGEGVDHRSDIFSLGCVLYEMVTGLRAFRGRTPADTLAAILNSEPLSLNQSGRELPPELERVIRRCLKKTPSERFSSAADFGLALRDIGTAEAPIALPDKRRLMRPPHSLYWIAAALAVLLLIGPIVYKLREPGVHASRIESVAVLPLENLSGDASQDYFADGMTEELITDLGKISALRVTSRSAVMKYKGPRKPLVEIARELKVEGLVEGSVLRSGGRVRVTARLVQPETNRSLWSENYERDLRDVLALQNEVARAIAKEVRAQLTGPEQASLGKARPVREDAYDDYLQAAFLGSHLTKSNTLAAIEKLERAVATDPSFAAGYAALAQRYADRIFFHAPEDRKQLDAKAYVATEKALSLDPDLADAYIARGRLLWAPANNFPHERAIREMQRAVALNPNSEDGHYQLALIYNHIGLLDKALQEAQRAAAINPSSWAPLHQIGNALLWKGKNEESLAVWRGIPVESFPMLVGSHTAWALFQVGRKAEASAKIAEFSRDYPEDPGGWFAGMQALLSAAAGQEGKAESAIRLALEKKNFGHFHHTAYWIACAYARMNKLSPAVDWLEKAAETGFPCYPLFERDPNLNSLRNDPRFNALLARMKKQWEHYQATL